jgi:hypothetical protein
MLKPPIGAKTHFGCCGREILKCVHELFSITPGLRPNGPFYVTQERDHYFVRPFDAYQFPNRYFVMLRVDWDFTYGWIFQEVRL